MSNNTQGEERNPHSSFFILHSSFYINAVILNGIRCSLLSSWEQFDACDGLHRTEIDGEAMRH